MLKLDGRKDNKKPRHWQRQQQQQRQLLIKFNTKTPAEPLTATFGHIPTGWGAGGHIVVGGPSATSSEAGLTAPGRHRQACAPSRLAGRRRPRRLQPLGARPGGCLLAA